MQHPYKNLPASAFWRRSVRGTDQLDFDPIVHAPWKISPADKIATSGSCFAQHISRALVKAGFQFLQTETPGPEDVSPSYSARYGNIYTTTQLHQLFERAYGLKIAKDKAWLRPDGKYVDPFRPREFPDGFDTIDQVAEAQAKHFDAVRTMFETCDYLVFTLGLTESWVSESDGMAVPLAPRVVADSETHAYRFENLSVSSVERDLDRFVDYLASVNPDARVILTVSPVPLEATFEDRHVLVSTTYSKAVLRVAAETLAQKYPARVSYFPSYEMVSAFPHNTSFEDDLRTVRPEVVAHVMDVFRRHYTDAEAAPAKPKVNDVPTPPSAGPPRKAIHDFAGVLCDEEMLGRV